jgi:hypothetical protein
MATENYFQVSGKKAAAYVYSKFIEAKAWLYEL